MQPNTITVPVDLLNNGTTTDETYERMEEHLHRSVYHGENHAHNARDLITLYRTYPKPSGNFLGVAKSAIKFTQDFTVSGLDDTTNIVSPATMDYGSSIPVGLTDAQLVVLRQRLIGLIDQDIIMNKLQRQSVI